MEIFLDREEATVLQLQGPVKVALVVQLNLPPFFLMDKEFMLASSC